MATITWHCYIDWNNDGDFGDTSEDVGSLMRDLIIKRGRDFYLAASGDSFEPVPPGELTVKIDNQDGRFNPYNSSSPIYPNVTPGRLIKITAVYNSTTYTLFTGRIKDIQPEGVDDRIVTITGLDYLQWLKERKNADWYMQYNYLVFDFIYSGLISVGWTFGIAADNNSDRIKWCWWVSNNLYDSYMELAGALMGKIFVRADGYLQYFSRNHVYTSVLSLDQSECLKNLPVPQPWEVVRNYIKVNTYPMTVEATWIGVWELNDPMYIGTGESVVFYATYNPAYDVQDSAYVVGDYQFWQYADGTGIDLHTNITVVSTNKFVKTTKVTVTNTGMPGYLTYLRVRGKPVACDNPVSAIEQDATSQAKYLLKEMNFESQYIQNAYFATEYAAYLISKLKDPVKYPVLYIDTIPAKQLALDLFSQIDFTAAALGISSTKYLISSIEHTWQTENGQSLLTKLTLEPPTELYSGYWIFSTNIGTTSYLAF